MSRTNPKEKYVRAEGKAVSYGVTRFESGSVFYPTAAAVVFTLPDSTVDADVVGCIVDFEYGTHPTEVAVDGGGADQIAFKLLTGDSIFLNSKGDSVSLLCLAVGSWVVTDFKGTPTLDDAPLAAQSIFEVVDTTCLVDVGDPYDVLHVTRTATDPVTVSFSSAWIAEDGNTKTIKDTGLNAGINNIALACVGGENIEGDPAGGLINGDGDCLTVQAFDGDLYVIGAKI